MFVPTKPVCCGGARYLVGIIGDDGFARPLLGAEIKEVCRLLNAKPALGERSEPALPLLGEAASEEAASQCEFAADALHKAELNKRRNTMKAITEGHRYLLESFESGEPQILQFIEKVPVSEGSTELRTVNDGTTNEEVLAMLLDRLNYLNKKFPCRENALAITKCEEALMWLNRRTANRVARGVEGKQIA